MDFINREKEIKHLNAHFESEPNCLLFVYGPKSSGKSTLLEKVVGGLDAEKYAVNFLDLRQVIIYNFQTFLDVFFQEDIKDKGRDILSGLTIKAGFFNVNFNEKALLKKNPFGLMVEKLKSANDRGVKPIIIIDEIQMLKQIALNGERYLIDELFNLFIAITKVKHLAHVILATSDSHFMEEIYSSASLEKASDFFLIDHFGEDDVDGWLKQEGFSKEERDDAWCYIGGCPWEIRQLIERRRRGESVRRICLDFIDDKYGKISNYRFRIQERDLRAEFDGIVKTIAENGFYLRHDDENTVSVERLLAKCIELDLWFYLANQLKITANSKSIFHAFKKNAEERG